MATNIKAKQTEIKKIGALSLGKIAAALYFIFGIIMAILVVVLKKIAVNLPNIESLTAFSQLTPGQILIIPIWQLVIGFIAGVVIALLYNLLAKYIGGIKIEI